MSMFSKALRATGLNRPGRLIGKAVSRTIPGAGLVIGGAQLLGLTGGGRGRGGKPPVAFGGQRPGLDFGDIPGLRSLTERATGRLNVQDGRCPQGFHLAKDGKGGCVRNRRMNPSNGRANARAIRRVRAAQKMFRKTFAVMGTKPGKIRPKGRK